MSTKQRGQMTSNFCGKDLDVFWNGPFGLKALNCTFLLSNFQLSYKFELTTVSLKVLNRERNNFHNFSACISQCPLYIWVQHLFFFFNFNLPPKKMYIYIY